MTSASLAHSPWRTGERAAAVGFVMEQTLGHVTHSANLQALLANDPRIRPEWRLVEYEGFARLPVVGNWTLQAGLQARRAIAKMHADTRLDALFIHTQVPAVMAGAWLRRIPTIVSVDATPLQYDDLGDHYRHRRAPSFVESLKWRLNRRCFSHAAHLVAWSTWAKIGLIEGYGVPADKITVVPPGVRTEDWQSPLRPLRKSVSILFVGGDLDRKGGRSLLEAFQRLRSDTGGPDVELHLVTQSSTLRVPGVTVHTGLTPNSEELRHLYRQADIFCLPTRGDCLPMVLSEAGAAGLPLVSTDVGAIPEIVREGETGLLVPPDDISALTGALRRLVHDPDLRRRLGQRAKELVSTQFDANTNADRLVDVLTAVAGDAGRKAATSHRRLSRSLIRRCADFDGSPRVLLTVSGHIPTDLRDEVAIGRRPRPDYAVMGERLGADLIDWDDARESVRGFGRVLGRLVGPNAVLALAVFRQRHRYDVILTDGEQIGLPYALLCRFGGRRRPRHFMIAHIMSVPKKAVLFRGFRLGRCIDKVFVYASAQRRFLVEELGIPPGQVVLTPFMVDTEYFAPTARPSRRMICSAGLEWRDYPTLIEAVHGLDVDVILAAASPWSKRRDTSRSCPIPSNVTVCKLNFADLRQVYAESLFVVVPLQEVPFQAGVTTLLEAMAMGKAVICSRTAGQTDVVVHGENGLYVPPGDAVALRRAIEYLLANPQEAERMGRAGRRMAEESMAVGRYAERFRRHVQFDMASQVG